MEAAMTPPLATFEDSTLIKLALEGQAECFSVLMDRHLVVVRTRIASMVRDGSDADDLLQEVSLKVWRYLSTFRAESSFRTWITRLAINEALQSYRREQSRPVCQPLGDFDAFASPYESPHRSLTRVEAAQSVRKAVAGLPEKYRQVLVLRDFEELSERDSSMPPIQSSGREDAALPGAAHALGSAPTSRIRG